VLEQWEKAVRYVWRTPAREREKERERGEELTVGGHEPGVDSTVCIVNGAGTDADNYTRCVLDWVTLSGIVCVDVFVTE
jgi:hypothetical protein